MEVEQKGENKKNNFIHNVLLKNLGVKIASLLFGVVIWGVVLTTQNPPRIKVITDVPVSFSTEYELHSKELVVRGNVLQELGGITVRVNTPVTTYRDFTKENLTAIIRLNNITSAGVWSLPIQVTTTKAGCTIDSVTPEKVQVEIDTLMTKRIPLEAYYEGALPEGYMSDPAQLSESSLEIRGPRQDAINVTKAICRIKMTGRTQSYNDALDVVLLDASGNEVDSSYFIGGLPTVTVSMPVYPKKTVPIDLWGSLLGADNLAANYELNNIVATPPTVDIRGDQEVLAGITALKVESIDLTGRKEGVHEKRALVLPEGVTLLTKIEDIDVFVDIREKMVGKVFEAVEIEPLGLNGKLNAVMSIEKTDVSIEGRVSLVEFLDRNEVKAYVDVNGLKEGTYELNVSVYLGDEETTLEVTSVLSVAKVTVTIS